MQQSYQVYLLINAEGRRYIGISSDVHRRLGEHNSGRSKWTKRGIPWTLRWQSQTMTLGEARKLENKLKRQKGGEGLRKLLDAYQAGS